MSYIPITHHIDRASLTVWSRHDIRKISVKKITEPKSFEKGGAVHPDGLYSPALGPTKRFDLCTTCGLSWFNCPGHYGHIDLPVPVYHPMLVQVMYQILTKSCFSCFHFRLPQVSLKLFLAQLEALNCGFDHLIDELDEITSDMYKGEKSIDESYLAVTIGQKLTARIKEEKEKTRDFDCQKRPQQRTIVERLSKLFRNFMTGALVKPAKICPHCHEKKTSIALHQNSVLVIGTNSSKPVDELDDLNSKSRKKRKRTKSSSSDQKLPQDLNYLASDDKRYLTPIGAKNFLRQLWSNEKSTMSRIFHFLNPRANDQLPEEQKVIEPVKEEDNCPKKQMKLNDDYHPVDDFFIDTILVPPSKFRPPMSQRGYSYEGPRTSAMSNVMKYATIVQDMVDQMFSEVDEVEAEKLQIKLQSQWKVLQIAVNSIYDNEMDKYGKNKYPGLKQLIDKKEGLFRKNMMGKRVNFAARSVISPDPNISVDQIGVPLVFAKKLTYPESVTPMNITQLKEAILNGPDNYPGAHSVVFDDGMTISLQKESVRQSIANQLGHYPRTQNRRPRGLLDKNKSNKDTAMTTIVNRHLLSGDVLLFNRQPTLHKPSIMAFRARVLPNEKGFRLHYANCKSFNADFDGDEMNAHLPQSELARSEAYNIASVNYQYLVPKDGSPLGGLIQDHVVSVCILSRFDQFLDQERYYQLVYCALCFLERPIIYEPATIIKPVKLWTGKQVITSIIKNCIPDGMPPPSLNIKSKIEPKLLNIEPKYVDLSDCEVMIRNGELVKGFMDKTNVGATQYGLIHLCYELYGGQTSSNLMSAFARLSTMHLQMYEGFTLGIKDILVDDQANEERKKLIKESTQVGFDSAKEALQIDGHVNEQELEDKMREAHSDRDPLPMKLLDGSMKQRTDKFASSIAARCLPNGLIVKFPFNNLQMMIQSGAKGGTVNALQISCLLGQIELEGRRVPLSMSGRSLPSFKPYDPSPKAGGFVTGRFLTGIQPQEFFFHCMAGREGLIDTAVKTSRSGYLQRCLIKHLEGITVHYDQTVRDSCGSVIQFLYGEDGLDIVKSQMLKEKAFSALVNNYEIVKPKDDEVAMLNRLRESYEEEVIAHSDLIQGWLDINGDSRVRKLRGSGFLDFLHSKLAEVKLNQQKDQQSDKYDDKEEEEEEEEEYSLNLEGQLIKNDRKIGSHHHDKIFEDWYALSFKEKRKWNKFWEACPDPLTAILNPASHFGVVPERLDAIIDSFVRTKLTKLTQHDFYNLCYNLYMKMLAQPGEAVGLLAAQSIGEPSTQMTLNTFHFAGRGEMNVTLGIPRLREILMTASAKIGTPNMDLPALAIMHDDSGNELDSQAMDEQMTRVRLALNAVRLSDVLEYIDITEKVVQLDAQQLELFGHSDRRDGRGTKRLRSSSRAKTSSSSSSGQSKMHEKNRYAVQYEFTFRVLPSKYYKHEFQSNSSKVMKFIQDTFIDQLIEAMIRRQKRLELADKLFDLSTKRINNTNSSAKHQSSTSSSSKQPDANEDAEENDLDEYNAKASAYDEDGKMNSAARDDEMSSSDDDEDGADGDKDNTAQRLKNRRNQDLDYDEPEDDDLEIGDIESKESDNEADEIVYIEPDEQSLNASTNDALPSLSTNHEQANLLLSAPSSPKDGSRQSTRKNGSLNNQRIATEIEEAIIKRIESKPHVKKFEYDLRHQRWCRLSIVMDMTNARIDIGALVENEAKRTYVHRVGNISRALLIEDTNAKSRGSKCNKMIKTEGVSLLSLVRFNHIIDLNAIYTNDIHAIANTYGIEAASQAIRREMANVFAVYGIQVDSRHLSLIADYMTYSGSIRGMNRMSMEASASPFQQMSFESTLRYLKSAAILGFHDDIKSPSAALVFGRPTRGGTGLFAALTADSPNTNVRRYK